MPWFLSVDHHNYTRWITVHIGDMESLPPTIKEENEQHGHWVVFKTTNRISAIPIDQAHKNNNDIVKGSGGLVGLQSRQHFESGCLQDLNKQES